MSRRKSSLTKKLPPISNAQSANSSVQFEDSSPFSGTGSLTEASSTTGSLADSSKSPKSLSDTTGSVAPKKGGRRKKGKAKVKEQVDERPKTPPYTGPPPTEELLDEVLTQSKYHVASGHASGQSGTVEQFEMLYDMIREGETHIGQEVNTRNGYGFTPLAVASAAGDASLVSLLLERRADVAMASTGRAELPLHHAATYRHTLVAQLLAEPCKKAGVLDARTCTGWTPLHLACSSGDMMILKILMKGRADLDTRNPQTGDEHALHCAIRNNNLDIIELLLAADAQVDCTDSLSRTPLHIAATDCNADGVSLLLRSRADPHHRGGPNHFTPLECVPAVHRDAAEDEKLCSETRKQREKENHEKVVRLLSSYMRAAPVPFRVDTRYDLRDSRDVI